MEDWTLKDDEFHFAAWPSGQRTALPVAIIATFATRYTPAGRTWNILRWWFLISFAFLAVVLFVDGAEETLNGDTADAVGIVIVGTGIIALFTWLARRNRILILELVDGSAVAMKGHRNTVEAAAKLIARAKEDRGTGLDGQDPAESVPNEVRMASSRDANPAVSESPDMEVRLREVEQLHAEGLISKEERDAKRREILEEL